MDVKIADFVYAITNKNFKPKKQMNKKIILLFFITIVAIGGFIFLNFNSENKNLSPESNEIIESTISPQELEIEPQKNWREIEIQNVITNEKLIIGDIQKPIILESFAVWCPTCKRQQDEIKELHEEIGDDVISISLDTDPNEDKEQVINHLTRYGFDWTFVIAPMELTRSLIDEFGVGIVNAPQAPIVIICQNKEVKFLGRGIKSSEELKDEINC